MTQLSDRFDRFRKKFAILHFKRIAGYQMRLVFISLTTTPKMSCMFEMR